MTGGIIQLVAYGQEDMFLSKNPQITFFKIVYRRHTNFSYEQIPQYFPDQQINFNKKISTTITKNGDLMGNIVVVTTLPKITQFNNSITKFAWVRRIGFALIKSVEIEINGHTIDKHYGDWLSIWAELTGCMSSNHIDGFSKMIGDVPELTSFTSTKDEYKLYVPLQFWFCRSSGLALPLLALQYSDVKINVEFNDADKCYILTPSHYITCEADLVNFAPYEYIEQTLDDDVRAGIFSHYDILTRRLYYYKITTNKLIGLPAQGKDINDPTVVKALLSDANNQKYRITGKTSHFYIYPTFNETSKTYVFSKIRNLNLIGCYLLINYYYLDNDERQQFLQSKHDYMIEQIYYTPPIPIESINRNVKITVDQPCKLLVWTTQMKYINDSKDFFNYTDSYTRTYTGNHTDSYIKNYDTSGQKPGTTMGSNIVINETILLNGRERVSMRNADYFNYIQYYQHFKYNPQTGVNLYSFGLHPTLIQPSGTCNMSQIDTIEIKLQLSHAVNILTPAYLRAYALCHNVFRVANGIGAMVFTK